MKTSGLCYTYELATEGSTADVESGYSVGKDVEYFLKPNGIESAELNIKHSLCSDHLFG